MGALLGIGLRCASPLIGVELFALAAAAWAASVWVWPEGTAEDLMDVIVGSCGVLVGLGAHARGEERLAAWTLLLFGAVLVAGTANELIGQPLDPRVR